ncbi:peroxiredoxin [methanotrophic endosymbiont of Bathymodiolus puteoserpentis (Logatchev)]|jgi:peroxiredoxin Q/BCP|uniref:peroxiredoxin n=1 Tax=methanotrophic endosymbiont of Bathymodiolus puteoserpentis (Logatchev) TaxID=343235 RepID=UPI0013CC5706|nr:peroxiredoxin [methanotrophic endosymbiont of Bathymodiolus puteoserpentis (Logatchev)]SHE22428.1 Thiol peroxidase, Bcp-type [methanotrophic endosymbiont of Bathymodiolus puteoserpentis (Logatchev)]
MSSVTLGSPVPNFEAISTGDKSIQLSDYRGKYLILYFYPRDNTPGCTTEGQNFRDKIAEFSALNAVILGVSRDSVRVHEGFKAKQNFPFDLLSDQEEKLCTLFDVIKMKNMYGKKVRGIERSTFLIDPNGILIHEWRKVKVKVHIDEVLQTLKELGA